MSKKQRIEPITIEEYQKAVDGYYPVSFTFSRINELIAVHNDSLGEEEHDYSHTHCFDQKQPSACGIPLEKHTQCCLCDRKMPKICEVSGQYGKDNNKDLHFYCEFCGEKMDYNEKKICKGEKKVPVDNLIDNDEWEEPITDNINTRLYYALGDISPVSDRMLSAVKSMEDLFQVLLSSERQKLREKMEKLKRILWSDDKAQHIRNIQNNETIRDVLTILEDR